MGILWSGYRWQIMSIMVQYRPENTRSGPFRRPLTQETRLLVKVALTFLVFCCLLLKGTLFNADSIDTKSTQSSTVAYFNAWTVGWNADRLKVGLRGYWNSPIFFPAEDTFAFSEPQPATLLVAPIVWASGSPLVAYKVWLLLCLVANGLAGVLISRRLGYQKPTQWVAGFSMILLPMSQQRIDVIQLVPVWGILWFYSSLFLLNKKATVQQGIECGCAFAVCFALCMHHSLFLSLVMAIACAVFLPQLRFRSFITSSLIAVCVAAALISPQVFPVLQAANEHQFTRSAQLVERLSAHPAHYLASQDNAWLDPLNWFDGLKPEAPGNRRFHIGWLRMIFAILAVGIAFRSQHNRRWTAFLLLSGISAFFFSLGPHWDVGGWKPWETIQLYVPGFKQVRNVFRFAWFVQIPIMLLAIAGFDSLLVRFNRRRAAEKPEVWRKAILVVIGLVLAAEVWPQPSVAHYVPSAHKHQEWVNFVRRECPPGQPIVCLPMAFGDRLKDMEIESRWMLLGLGHGVPMLNGYSGFFPDSYNRIVDTVNAAGASDELFSELMKRRVGLVVVARGFPFTKAVRNFQSDHFQVEHLFADEIGVDVYSFRMKL